MGAKAKAKPETSRVQILALARIAVDHALQSRVATSIAYQREFSEAMLRGDVFPPVTVFFDGQTYWLADGFHRLGAAREAAKLDPNYRGIRAEVREGTRRDAVIFSAGANQKWSIPRGDDDVKKAVYMLLALPEWFDAAAAVIARHVGCSPHTVLKVRSAYCHEKGLALPEKVRSSDGREVASKMVINNNINNCANKKKKGTPYFARLNGTRHYLGTDGARAGEKAREIQSEFEERRRSLRPDDLAMHFARRGLVFQAAGLHRSRFPGLAAYHGHGVVYVSEGFARRAVGPRCGPGSVPEAVGRLLLARVHIDPGARAVVICYKSDAPPALVELAERLGVEFLTPDELVASVGAPEPGPTTPR